MVVVVNRGLHEVVVECRATHIRFDVVISFFTGSVVAGTGYFFLDFLRSFFAKKSSKSGFMLFEFAWTVLDVLQYFGVCNVGIPDTVD